jgi:hypothetical protein
LKFVEEIKKIIDLLKDKDFKDGILVKVLTLLARVCGFFYYSLDNIIWIANLGMIRYDCINYSFTIVNLFSKMLNGRDLRTLQL